MAVKIEELKKLSDPEFYKSIGIEKKWRVQRIVNGTAFCVVYVDARDVQNLLDSVCGSENWCNNPLSIDGRLHMQIGINIEGEGWVFKSDVGTETNVEKEKGQASDALKRAAVMWGCFRENYTTGMLPLTVRGKTPLSKNGTLLDTPEKLSSYCNNLNTGVGRCVQLYTEFKPQFDANDRAKEALKQVTEFLKTIKQ